MAYKYKLNEMSKTASPEAAEKELGIPKSKFEIGQVSFSDDGTRKSTIYKIDPETGAIGWKIEQLPGFDKLYDEMDDLVDVAKRVYIKTKDDKVFRDIYEEGRKLRNKIRTHLRNEYPDQYKRMTRIAENVDVIDISPSNNIKLRKFIQDAPTFAQSIIDISDEILADESSNISQNKNIRDAFLALKREADKNKKIEESNNPGASLGPGPKAGPDGVTDSAYTKQFKYKLVKKNKDGTYVQKGSTLPVRKLWGE